MVSVIVPVYNVEKYLRQCLDSLKAQTLEDVEFIVIDDGSTDGSGTICDEYSLSDEKFRVFHTENRGLSAARNRGIDEARGEWIEFVDSDDWVAPGFCEIPLKAAFENNADLVIFQSESATERGRIRKGKNRFRTSSIISHEQAIDYGGVAVWNKLYSYNLFRNIIYPEGHVYEDIAITHKIIYVASCIMLLNDSLLYHRKRKMSISHAKDKKSLCDLLNFHNQRYHDLVKLGYPVRKAKEYMQDAALIYCIYMSKDKDLFLSAERTLKEITQVPGFWNLKKLAAFILWKKNKAFFHFVFFCLKMKV